MITALEYLAFGGALVSTWLYGNNSRWGPVSGMVVATLFITFGVVAQIYAAAISNVVFLGIHARNYWRSRMNDAEIRKSVIARAAGELQNFAVNGDDPDLATRIRNLYRLMETCHEASWEAGWWHDDDGVMLPFENGKRIALAHSELSEAMEAHRKELNDDKLIHRPGVEVELADFLIRIFDCMGYLWKFDQIGEVSDIEKGVLTMSKLNRTTPGILHDDVLLNISNLHMMVSTWFRLRSDDEVNTPRIEAHALGATVAATLIAAYACGLDVPGALAEKLEYNANRPDHKRENRAKAGGKAY